MKPLLRVVLVIDALPLLAGGLLFVMTPWKGLYDALQLVPVDPAMVAVRPSASRCSGWLGCPSMPRSTAA